MDDCLYLRDLLETKAVAYPAVMVCSGFARLVADNGQRGDARVQLLVAPRCDGGGVVVYLETNGDPVLIGTVHDNRGETLLDATQGEATQDMFAGDEWAWLRGAFAANDVTVQW